MWNPFKYFQTERQKDRELMLAALAQLLEAQNRQADVAIEQSRALRVFIDSFMVAGSEPTSRRVSTDESECDAEKLSWGLYGES